tara:strand:- start:4981 stop:5370 length:390 start_codon:yes stop_codon:yes gene_type:complete
MAKDYSGAKALADRAMAKFGRAVDMLSDSRVETDTDQPWLGTSTTETRLTGRMAIFVPVAGDQTVSRIVSDLGGSTRRRVDTFLIGAVAGYDLSDFQKIVDGDKIWKIGVVHVIAPGDTVLLYQIEVSG